MTIEQTVEIPASHRLTIEIPKEIPAGRTRVLIQFPEREKVHTDATMPAEAQGQSHNETFRRSLKRAYGAWKDNPWTNHTEDITAMRDEWNHRDFWSTNPATQHFD